MIYEVKKDDIIMLIADTVFFAEQPKAFKTMFRELEDPDNPGYAEFDDCRAYLTELDRILFSPVKQNL